MVLGTLWAEPVGIFHARAPILFIIPAVTYSKAVLREGKGAGSSEETDQKRAFVFFLVLPEGPPGRVGVNLPSQMVAVCLLWSCHGLFIIERTEDVAL